MERRSSDIPYVPRARIEVCPHRNANALWTRTPVFIEGRQGIRVRKPVGIFRVARDKNLILRLAREVD
jgi:hypothetical protein